MADGRVVTFPFATIDHPGVVAHLDDVTSYVEVGVVAPFDARRGTGVGGVPSVIAQSVTARRARLWDGIYFATIHVVPRVKELGAVISATSYPVEVWNADDVAHLGVSVTVNGSSGVTLSGGPTLPSMWAPFSSNFFDVNVAADGDPIIDALIDWLFPGFEGTDHRVLGFKLTILAIGPDWDKDGAFSEEFGYQTSLRRSRAGNEQRRLLRGRSSRRIAFEGFAPDALVAGELLARLWAGGQYLFGLPYWPDAIPLEANITAGGTVVSVTTAGTIFEAGGLLLLWRDARTWQTLTIAPGGVAPTQITVANPIAAAWPAGTTLVIPVLPAFLESPAAVESPAPGLADVRATFETETLL